MARNTNYPYDPYTGEVPIEAVNDVMTVGGIAQEVMNPINWLLWKYQYNPQTYSFFRNRGISTNFQSQASMAEGLKNIHEGFKGGFWKGMGSVWENKKQFFGKSRWIFGKDWIADANLQKYKAARTLGRLNAVPKKLETVKTALDEASRLVAPPYNPYMQIKLNRRERRLGELVTKYEKNIASPERATAIKNATKVLSDAKFKIGAQSLIRWGLVAPLKIFAGVGLITTAWDISKMVGEPIGRYIVENANRVGLAFSNRYMPETGGKITMSYMSSGAATERQRAIQAISKSYINGRSAIGQEAMFLHE